MCCLCPLCLEPLFAGDNGRPVELGPCRHRFHLACIVKEDTKRYWSSNAPPASATARPCPLCRADASGPPRTVFLGRDLDLVALVGVRDFVNMQLVFFVMRVFTGADDDGLQPLFASAAAAAQIYEMAGAALATAGRSLATTRDVREMQISTNFVYLPTSA